MIFLSIIYILNNNERFNKKEYVITYLIIVFSQFYHRLCFNFSVRNFNHKVPEIGDFLGKFDLAHYLQLMGR